MDHDTGWRRTERPRRHSTFPSRSRSGPDRQTQAHYRASPHAPRSMAATDLFAHRERSAQRTAARRHSGHGLRHQALPQIDVLAIASVQSHASLPSGALPTRRRAGAVHRRPSSTATARHVQVRAVRSPGSGPARSIRCALADTSCASACSGAGGSVLMEQLASRWLRPGRTSPHDVRLDLLFLLGLCLCLVATGIGLRDPWPADEPRFAQIAREMVASGAWLVPRIGGDLYADKPPLYFWLLALGLSATGSIRASFLLPSFVSALGCVVLVYDLGRRLFSRETGLLAATLLLFTVQFVWQARQAQIDATLCFFITLSLYGLLRHLLLGPSWRWYIVGWAAAGLGVITKGVGFLPLLILIPWALLRARWRLPRFESSAWWWLAGPFVFACAIGAWLVPMLLATSGDPGLAAYRDEILLTQTARRYFDAWHHVEPFWYFLVEVIPILWLPATALLPWLVPRWRAAWRTRQLRIVLPLSWVVLVVLFFSLSTGKRGVYVLPAVPAFVLAVSPYLVELARERHVRRVMFALALAVGAATFVAALYLWSNAAARDALLADYGIDAVGPALAISALALAVSILLRTRGAFLAYAGALASALLLISFWINPALND